MNDEFLAAALLDASPDGLLLVGPDGVIEVANRAAGEVFGYTVDNLVGLSVEELVPADQRARHVEHRTQFAAHPRTRPMGSGLQLSGRRADGTYVPLEVSISPLDLDGSPRTIATVRDITEREATNERIALLRDRERIARDLHDMVIQRLFAAGMGLQAVENDAGSDLVAERIRTTVDELDATVRELRAAIFQLGDDDLSRSVATQLTELVLGREGSLGFTPELQIDGDVDAVHDLVVEQLTATINEALANVARHSGATAASVRIDVGDSELVLEITDNGRGMGETPKRRGGLANMMWRAAELGGECTVSSAGPSGLTLRWKVPR